MIRANRDERLIGFDPGSGPAGCDRRLRPTACAGLYFAPEENASTRWEEEMLGLMSERPLLISGILTHAALYHADTEVVTRTVEGPIHRYTYAEAEPRAKRLARALLRLGIRSGDRVATMAWNTYCHFELYYGISSIGAVCHTINPRLFDEQIT